MILIDISGVMIANIMEQISQSGNEQLDENLIRHMVLNSIRKYNMKFGQKYGEIIICCDDKNYWRKDIFPYYKAKRKKTKDDSKFDWNLIYNTIDKMKDELRDHFPYKVLQIEKAEADDIIGALVYEFGCELGGDPILIISNDKDFIQLQTFSNVEQYSSRQDKFIRSNNPDRYLKEMFIRGDSDDSVPNFLSDDDVFIGPGRQKSIFAKKVDVWLDQEPEEFCDEKQLENYKRNQKMIDLSMIPDEIRNKIVDKYNTYKTNTRGGLLNYFIKYRLKNLMSEIGDF